MRDEMRGSQIARAILEYLHDRPAAQDTLTGIVEWWLPQRPVGIPSVKRALDELTGRGFVLRHKAKDSRIHYRRNRRKP